MVVAVTIVKLESAVALVAITDVAVKKLTVAAKNFNYKDFINPISPCLIFLLN